VVTQGRATFPSRFPVFPPLNNNNLRNSQLQQHDETMSQTNPPNQTLYVQNLNDKIRKPDLRLSLYTLFGTYGVVLDVVALKTSKARGQAFIAFRDVASATQAMRALDGFNFFGKEMVRISRCRPQSLTGRLANVPIRESPTPNRRATRSRSSTGPFGCLEPRARRRRLRRHPENRLCPCPELHPRLLVLLALLQRVRRRVRRQRR
jgi:RNA recognition motif-containing protein